MEGPISECNFPVSALVPKTETGVLNFLQKYPEYDGRDVTIAIFDSGVDPLAAGLKYTGPDLQTKVIERFDCSGCGDTDTSKKVTASADGYITGISGRQLKLTPFMKANNKDGNDYRVGLKSILDVYPNKFAEKFMADQKLKEWDEPHKKTVAEISRQLHSLDKSTSSNDTPGLSLKDKLNKENLENTMEFLNSFDKKFTDIKTSYDCILFHTGTHWCAVIDTTETGNLENAVVIAEYTKTHEVKHINDLLSVSINVHDDGDVLEIVGICTAHGTHVACIASGNQEDPELNGVARAAKIVSMTIGDGRLGSMETGTALVRAIIKVMELCNNGIKIDVINMSYGEFAHWSNSGRIGRLMNEVVNKYGVVWVASAGNHGPALCTIGTPPDISQPSCIGVGAYVSSQMMEAEYALREKLPSNVYTWTSRDPCIDGGQGVTVCAPGAAITSVPEFTMARAQLMNGTSMAAPHVAGAIALLISGLKQRHIKYSPFSIKRAIWNTATKLSYVDEFAQGNGLLNVDRAFENLVQYANEQENLIRFSIRVGNNAAKGIHLRTGPLKKPVETNVTIEPIFFNDKEAALKDKINFNVRLCLTPTEPWVQCGAFLDLCYSSRIIAVKVDPTGLPPGVYTTRINAYDSKCIEKGTLFHIPITVIQPHTVNVEETKTITSDGVVAFKPNTIKRLFVQVPNNATWAVLKMISVDDNKNAVAKFFIHTMQLLPMRYCKAKETMKILPLSSENETVYAFKCKSNGVLELCIAKYWSDLGEVRMKYSLEFHGVNTNGPNTMHPANGIHQIDITTLGPEEILPAAQLKTATMVLKPIESQITPLSKTRDVIPHGRQIYQNVLTYSFQLNKNQEVTIHAPLFSHTLYESEYESQLWMLFDSNKVMGACADAYSNATYIKLDKGEYTIKLQIRHEKKDALEKISEATMLVTFKLPSSLSLDIYDHYNQAIIAGKKVNMFTMKGDSPKTLYIAPISNERLSKASIPQFCSWLGGSIVHAKDEVGRRCDGQYFQYTLIEGPSNKKSNGTPKRNNKIKLEEFNDNSRDYTCTLITKLAPDMDAAEQIYKKTLQTSPKHLPLHLAFMQVIENSINDGKIFYPFAFEKWINTDTVNNDKPDTKKLIANWNKIIELADIIINETDKNALLAYYGLKSDSRSDAAKIKSNMDKQKNTLVDALVMKGIALNKLSVIDEEPTQSESSGKSSAQGEIDAIFEEVYKYMDTSDLKVINFSIWHAYSHSQYGRMLKYLTKVYDEKLNRDVLEEIEQISIANQWDHVTKAVRKINVSSNPGSYRPF